MKATVFLAEAAVGHPDGTFSMLRAGVGRVAGEKWPLSFRGFLVACITLEPSERGKLGFSFEGRDPSGQPWGPRVLGEMDLEEATSAVVPIRANLQFPSEGNYSVTFSIGGNAMDVLTIVARPIEQQKVQP